jgi:hypothetical protein
MSIAIRSFDPLPDEAAEVIKEAMLNSMTFMAVPIDGSGSIDKDALPGGGPVGEGE